MERSRQYNHSPNNTHSQSDISMANSNKSYRRNNQQRHHQAMGKNSNMTSNVSLISNQVSPIQQFDLVTLLQASHNLTSRQKQLLIAIQQSDTQYLVDMDILRVEQFESFKFTFSDFKITPLMLACAIGNLNIVAILIEGPLEKSKNFKDSQGFNCLYYAVYHGHLEVVRLLKRWNVEYEKDDKGTSCLHIAIMKGYADIVSFLLYKTPEVAQDLKAKVSDKANAKDKDQKQIKKINTAIQWEKGIDVDEQRVTFDSMATKEEERKKSQISNGISTVFFAIRSGSVAMMKVLRKYGANFNLECQSESRQMMRPIQYAVYRGNYQMYKLVLEYNSDYLESQYTATMPSTGSNLLHLCAFKGNSDILKDLLNHNMSPFQPNKQGDTCLHMAVRKRHYDFCMELVRWAVSKNMTAAQAEIENTTESLTPFMTAVLREQYEIANLLLKNNLATKGYVNKEGRTLKQIAEDNNRERALAFLENREGAPQLKRDKSIDQVYQNSNSKLKSQKGRVSPDHRQFANRKASVDPVPYKRDDIFGNSATREMFDANLKEVNGRNITISKQNEEGKEQKPVRLLKASGQQSFDKPVDPSSYGGSPLKPLKGSHLSKIQLSDAQISQRSSQQSNSKQYMASPEKRPLRAPKMPKLSMDNDDVDKVNVRDFIKNSKR